MEARFLERPGVVDLGVHHPEQGHQHLLQRVADPAILLRRLAHHRDRKDGIAAVCHLRQVEDRLFTLVGIVPEVVAERPFPPSFARRHDPFQHEIGRGGHEDRHAHRPHRLERRSPEERGKRQFVDVLGQGRHGGEHEDRVAPEDTAGRQRLAARLGLPVVERAPLLDLHVQTGGAPVEDLHPIGAEIAASRDRVLREHHRPGDERTAVLRPAGEDRKSVEIRVGHDVAAAPVVDRRDLRAEGAAEEAAGLPERPDGGGLQSFGRECQFEPDRFRFAPEGETDPLAPREEIRHHREFVSLDLFEKERRSVQRGGAGGDLRDLEARGHRDRHPVQLTGLRQGAEERAQPVEPDGARGCEAGGREVLESADRRGRASGGTSRES